MSSTCRNLFKLYDLIQNGDSCKVRRFLSDSPIDVNILIPCKNIGVLHLAVGIEPLEKSKECTEILLKYGADPNICTEDGITPLHIAAIWGRVENLKLLIGCGGDPSWRDFDGHSAFDYAAREQQWEVFDYLHNVEDQLDDSFGAKCAYGLQLDKILVRTDQMVAEYGQVADERPCDSISWRKSQMVREWCEKTTLTMNKLYPTIMGETYILNNESLPFYESKITNEKIEDLSQENVESSNSSGTKASYKTCLTQRITPKDIKISGIAPLDQTNNETKDNNICISTSKSDQRKRFSVYENFSLPGSPNSIVHTNYHTKSSLKKSKNSNKDSSSSKQHSKHSIPKMVLDDHISLITDDESVQSFEKAIEVAQNQTNERISNNCDEVTEVRASNTRRSSASSGVSSNFSSGSIAVANVEEEYKYHDKEEDVVLIERRMLLSTVVVPVEELPESSSVDQTIVSIASSLPSSIEYDNHTLRAELLRLGFKPGPIDASTRTLYLKKLKALKKNPIVVQGQQGKTYSIELEKSFRNPAWMTDLSLYAELEARSRADFANPSRKWREGTAKTSFTYLLLDPRLTDNLPVRASKHTPHENWIAFVNSIFYVGKGKRSRPYSHLYQALTLWKKDFTTSKDKKVQHILDIWSNKVGVVCLHIFQNVIPAEAYTYEAAMIDVLGLSNLKNLKVGNYYGATASWPLKERRMLGLYLLYKAMLIFLSEGERQLRPDDID